MKAKAITSGTLGLLLPWLYFMVITASPVIKYDEAGNKSIGSSGVQGFIEFHGIANSFIIYAKAIAVCSILIFAVCVIYEFIAKQCASRP